MDQIPNDSMDQIPIISRKQKESGRLGINLMSFFRRPGNSARNDKITFPPRVESQKAANNMRESEPSRSGIPIAPEIASQEAAKVSWEVEPDRSGLVQVPAISRKGSQRTHSNHELDDARRIDQIRLIQPNLEHKKLNNKQVQKLAHERDPYDPGISRLNQPLNKQTIEGERPIEDFRKARAEERTRDERMGIEEEYRRGRNQDVLNPQSPHLLRLYSRRKPHTHHPAPVTDISLSVSHSSAASPTHLT